MNIEAVIGIIGAAATVMTVFIVPFSKWIKKRRAKKNQEKQQELAREQKIVNSLQEIKDDLSSFREDYDDFTTQNLKYMINDAFFGYNSIHEIPDDILINACECCDIYINKKKRNHEMKPRCEMIWKELERRAVSREVSHE